MINLIGSLVDIEYYLPEAILSNHSLKNKHPEWNVPLVEKKTGVLSRHIAKFDETAFDLGRSAVEKLLQKHPGLVKKIDAIIFCTQSPDYVMPSNSFLLQKDLNFSTEVICFDFNLACSGFAYGILMATSFISAGLVKNVLLVTADTYSKLIDQNDRSTTMLFGDGASATWISGDIERDHPVLIKKFTDVLFEADGKIGWDKFIVRGGGSRNPELKQDTTLSKINMDGLQVVNFAKNQVASQIKNLMEKNGVNDGDISQFFFHQGSGLALDVLIKKLSIPKNKVFSNIENTGNTVSSSLPILICDYFKKNKLHSGDKLIICGFGVGYSWVSFLATV